MYAVIDLETTGLRTGWHDRIVEVAVVHLDGYGRIEREWCSLVNPQRDMGPQHIHGISAAEARRAPTFDKLAGAVADLLHDRVVVAHNLRFDAPFLAAEYQRLGIGLPISVTTGLCTMNLAGQFLPGAGRSLADCCLTAHVELGQAHSALHDARAAAALLRYYLKLAGQPPPWAVTLAAAAAAVWPELPHSDALPARRQSPGHHPEHFLARLVARLPRINQPHGDAYLAMLDQALLDRHISAVEADALVTVAEQLDLGRYEVMTLHEQYLQALAIAALEDGILSDDEHDDLTAVTGLLGLHSEHLASALDIATGHPTDQANSQHTPITCTPPGRFALHPGDVVVFTGQMDQPREAWEQRAQQQGLAVAASVTKKTRLLIAADPDSDSSKARKAHQYGIPIIRPAAFDHIIVL